MQNPAVTLELLPNEVYIQILSDLSTRDLLPLTSVNHRFHAIVLRILHHRLLLNIPLKEYKLILECFHHSSQFTEPHVFCKYLGTDGLSERHGGMGSLHGNADTVQQLAVTGLYSRFRPEPSVEGEDHVRETSIRSSTDEGQKEDKVIREIQLGGYERFYELCVVANLVQVRPGTSLLLSVSNIQDGLVQLWREWLDRQSQKLKKATQAAKREGLEEIQMPSDGDDMLWVDEAKTVGLKMRVRPKSWSLSMPVLMHIHDEGESPPVVAYEVVIEELHIRSTLLLLVVEQSKQEQMSPHTNAMVIGAPPPA